MPKYDFNKVAKQLKLNLVTCCFATLYYNSIYFIALQLHIFGTPFLTKTPGWLLLNKARIQMLTVEKNIRKGKILIMRIWKHLTLTLLALQYLHYREYLKEKLKKCNKLVIMENFNRAAPCNINATLDNATLSGLSNKPTCFKYLEHLSGIDFILTKSRHILMKTNITEASFSTTTKRYCTFATLLKSHFGMGFLL